jgi:hypothetical protein
LTPVLAIMMVKSTCVPPGSGCGRQCPRSPLARSGSVSARGDPPVAGTADRPEVQARENRITSFEHQQPPGEPPPASATVTGSPPASDTRFTCRPAKNAIARPSGDIIGPSPPSVPGITVVSKLSSERRYKRLFDSKTSTRPSGVSWGELTCPRPGAGTKNRTGAPAAAAGVRWASHPPAKPSITAAATRAAVRTMDRDRASAVDPAGSGCRPIAASSSPTSPMSRCRARGSFSRQRASSSFTRDGVDAGSASRFGVSFRTDASVSLTSSPLKARSPASIS